MIVRFQIFAFSLFTLCSVSQEVKIEADFGLRHEIGGQTGFDRWKFITAHSFSAESDWLGEREKLSYLCDELDVYFGRDSGTISHDLKLLREDPKHRGYVEFADMKRRGDFRRQQYQQNSQLHRLANRNDIVVCAQVEPFWPGSASIVPEDGSSPWKLAGPDATAQFMVYWLNMYTGGNGPPRPRYLEIINEPLYELANSHPGVTPKDVFLYHQEVARGIRALNSEIQLGGYTAAFPDFEKDNFNRWETRWKSFIDLMGDEIDFYSFHLYDFPGIHGGKEQYRKGANLEATLDLLEHYSSLKFGRVKPFLISEYGSQLHDWFNQPWSPFRDWLCLKAMNSMLMQLSARPDRIHKAIPFVPVKAEWGFNYGNSNQPYYWRLLRRENEPREYSGEWVFTDLIKFYQLWSGVRGRRYWIESSDANVLTASYLEGTDAYLILNNLSKNRKSIFLDINGLVRKEARKLQTRHLYLFQNEPKLDWNELPNNTDHFELGGEATMVIHLSLASPLESKPVLKETKFYANSYLKEISKNKPIQFELEDVTISEQAKKATLRVGIGRDHGLSVFPVITFNDLPLKYMKHYRGPSQLERDRFFGVLEIPVPTQAIKKANDVRIAFPDSTGHVSSVSMVLFD